MSSPSFVLAPKAVENICDRLFTVLGTEPLTDETQQVVRSLMSYLMTLVLKTFATAATAATPNTRNNARNTVSIEEQVQYCTREDKETVVAITQYSHLSPYKLQQSELRNMFTQDAGVEREQRDARVTLFDVFVHLETVFQSSIQLQVHSNYQITRAVRKSSNPQSLFTTVITLAQLKDRREEVVNDAFFHILDHRMATCMYEEFWELCQNAGVVFTPIARVATTVVLTYVYLELMLYPRHRSLLSHVYSDAELLSLFRGCPIRLYSSHSQTYLSDILKSRSS